MKVFNIMIEFVHERYFKVKDVDVVKAPLWLVHV